MITRLLVVLAIVATTACGVSYTSIRQEPDGSYIISGAHAGVFRSNGEIHRCTSEGNKMRCNKVSDN